MSTSSSEKAGASSPSPIAATYGVRIQDFRVSNLSRQTKIEKMRQVEMQAELHELFQSPYADGKHPVFDRKKPEGWVRLPLLQYSGIRHYQVDLEQVEGWVNHYAAYDCSTPRREDEESCVVTRGGIINRIMLWCGVVMNKSSRTKRGGDSIGRAEARVTKVARGAADSVERFRIPTQV